jgi:hypothetical protein
MGSEAEAGRIDPTSTPNANKAHKTDENLKVGFTIGDFAKIEPLKHVGPAN